MPKKTKETKQKKKKTTTTTTKKNKQTTTAKEQKQTDICNQVEKTTFMLHNCFDEIVIGLFQFDFSLSSPINYTVHLRYLFR